MQGLNRVLGRPELARMLGFLYLKSDFCEVSVCACVARRVYCCDTLILLPVDTDAVCHTCATAPVLLPHHVPLRVPLSDAAAGDDTRGGRSGWHEG